MIDDFKYGCFHVNGKEYLGDLLMVQDKPHYWQNRQGRELLLEELKVLFPHNPEVIVIGTGAGGLFNVSEEVVQRVYQRGIRMIIDKNTVAIKKYNQLLSSGKKVCGLFPGEC